MKIILYADEKIYQDLYHHFSIKDENNEERFYPNGELMSYFDRNYSYIYHIVTNQIINFAIDNLGGYRNVTHVIIQKSFYKNKDLIRILRKFKFINPNVKVCVFMDVNVEFYELFMSVVVKENLALIVNDINSIDDIFEEFENINQEQLIINKPTRQMKKEFKAY